MRLFLHILRYVVHPLYLLMYLWFLLIGLLWLRARWLQLRLLRQYSLYTCGKSLAVQIRPDLGQLRDRYERAEEHIAASLERAKTAWGRLSAYY